MKIRIPMFPKFSDSMLTYDCGSVKLDVIPIVNFPFSAGITTCYNPENNQHYLYGFVNVVDMYTENTVHTNLYLINHKTVQKAYKKVVKELKKIYKFWVRTNIFIPRGVVITTQEEE